MSSDPGDFDQAAYEAENQEMMRKLRLIISSSLRYRDDRSPNVVMGCQVLRVRRRDPSIHSLEFNDLTKMGLELAVYNEGGDTDSQEFNNICCNTGFSGFMDHVNGRWISIRSDGRKSNFQSCVTFGFCKILLGEPKCQCQQEEEPISWEATYFITSQFQPRKLHYSTNDEGAC